MGYLRGQAPQYCNIPDPSKSIDQQEPRAQRLKVDLTADWDVSGLVRQSLPTSAEV